MKKDTTNNIYILLHNIRSIHNVGSIFRTADAAGVSKIYLTGYTPTPLDRFGREVEQLAKVSLGGEKSVVWEYYKTPLSLLKKLKKQGVSLIGVEQDQRAIDYKKVKISQDSLIVFGNEVEGIEKSILNLCDVIAEIPMKGTKESLNVAVSCGITLFRILNI